MTTTSKMMSEEKSQRSSRSVRVAKIVELIGTSDKSWEDAAQVAIEEARKTIHGIHGIKMKDMTARVDPETGKLIEYRTCIDLSFGVIDEER
ncbi:MAG TPA: dodecin family protein [Nitrososphaera sp.]|jgi:dodecin|nr:dodecin family protein [Nitrososphaera sp.]